VNQGDQGKSQQEGKEQTPMQTVTNQPPTQPTAKDYANVLQIAVDAIDQIFGAGYAKLNPALVVATIGAVRPIQIQNNYVKKYSFGDDTVANEALTLKP
jgi:hypothetical protein